MTGIVQCDACGARNQADAAWCTQCYERLGAATSPVDEVPAPQEAPRRPPIDDTDGLLPLPPGGGEDAGHAVDDADADDARRGREVAPLEAGEGRFRDAGTGLQWRCDTCGEWNAMEQVACTVCGTPFGSGSEPAAPVRPAVAPAVLAAASVALPGAGHALLGMWGQAFVRGSLALVWGIGGLTLLLDALGAGQSVVPAVPLLVGWLLLVATAVNDVLVEGGAPGRVLLQGRLLLWLVMGVIGATMAAAFLGAFTAFGGGGG